MTDLELQSALDALNKKFDHVDKKVGEIYNAIAGNEKLGADGIVKRLRVLEAESERWKMLYYKGIGIITGIMLIWEVVKSIIELRAK